jgi:hypothetical protein
MEKYCQLASVTRGVPTSVTLFGSHGQYEKVAGAPPFADWETGDEIRGYVEKLTAKDRKENCYVLSTALSASEYFGANANADWFGWAALSHAGKDYGYQTFLQANVFQHHQNSDPAKGFGKPDLALLNHSMYRVELILKLDREKAKLVGCESTIQRVDAGELGEWSMGARVPFDSCMLCGHKSKTRADYCVHMRPPPHLAHLYGPRRVLPDGRVIAVDNPNPRFFDYSDVYVGADKTAKTIAKLASKGKQLCFGPVCALPLESTTEKTAEACCQECADKHDLTKQASEQLKVKKTAAEKLSEMLKTVPAESAVSLEAAEKVEPDLSAATLDMLAQHPLTSSLAGLSSLGFLLKPHEFQRIVLVRCGESALADTMDEKNLSIRQTADVDPLPRFDLSAGDDLVPGLLRHLADLLEFRTTLGNSFKLRISGMKKVSAQKLLPKRTEIGESALDKLSAAYNGYRLNFLTNLIKAADVVSRSRRGHAQAQQASQLFGAVAGCVSLRSRRPLPESHDVLRTRRRCRGESRQ